MNSHWQQQKPACLLKLEQIIWDPFHDSLQAQRGTQKPKTSISEIMINARTILTNQKTIIHHLEQESVRRTQSNAGKS